MPKITLQIGETVRNYAAFIYVNPFIIYYSNPFIRLAIHDYFVKSRQKRNKKLAI